MEPFYLLLIFLAGGSIVAGTIYISDLVDPEYGGILAVAPIITTLAFLFISMHSTQERTHELILGSIAFLVRPLSFSYHSTFCRAGMVSSQVLSDPAGSGSYP